jgi:hypothetical protein
LPRLILVAAALVSIMAAGSHEGPKYPLAARVILATPAPGYTVSPTAYSGQVDAEHQGLLQGLYLYLKKGFHLDSAWQRVWSNDDYSEDVAVEAFVLGDPSEAATAFKPVASAFLSVHGSFTVLARRQLSFPASAAAEDLYRPLAPTPLYASQALIRVGRAILVLRVEKLGALDDTMLDRLARDQYLYAASVLASSSRPPDHSLLVVVAAAGLGTLLAGVVLAFAAPRRSKRQAGPRGKGRSLEAGGSTPAGAGPASQVGSEGGQPKGRPASGATGGVGLT